MIRANRDLNNSLSRLSANSDFMALVKHLEDSLADQMLVNIDLSGEEAHKGQGRAAELRDIVAAISDAKAALRGK